ncbi:hypothetical protein GCM10028772_02940 [Nocardioides ultimimeridianus]
MTPLRQMARNYPLLFALGTVLLVMMWHSGVLGGASFWVAALAVVLLFGCVGADQYLHAAGHRRGGRAIALGLIPTVLFAFGIYSTASRLNSEMVLWFVGVAFASLPVGALLARGIDLLNDGGDGREVGP